MGELGRKRIKLRKGGNLRSNPSSIHTSGDRSAVFDSAACLLLLEDRATHPGPGTKFVAADIASRGEFNREAVKVTEGRQGGQFLVAGVGFTAENDVQAKVDRVEAGKEGENDEQGVQRDRRLRVEVEGDSVLRSTRHELHKICHSAVCSVRLAVLAFHMNFLSGFAVNALEAASDVEVDHVLQND
jgi:hypothetical protein